MLNEWERLEVYAYVEAAVERSRQPSYAAFCRAYGVELKELTALRNKGVFPTGLYDKLRKTTFSPTANRRLRELYLMEELKRQDVKLSYPPGLENLFMEKLLESRGLTRLELAGKLGINGSHIDICFGGYKRITPTLYKALLSFGLTMEELSELESIRVSSHSTVTLKFPRNDVKVTKALREIIDHLSDLDPEEVLALRDQLLSS